ncbi:MAG: nitrate reductase, partial [Caldimonas sp.]
MADTRSTCPYCGVGCGVIIESGDGRVTGVRGDPDHPANFGRLCSKGSTLHLTATDAVRRDERLLRPMWRPRRGELPQPAGWDDTLERLADRYAQIVRAHGPDSVAFYVSGQLLTEEYYVFNKLAKGLIGTNNIDTNSRLCMSSAVAGYKQSLGADAPPACYEDLDHADCLFIAGSNTAWAHPILFRRIEDAKAARPDMKIIVVDPRRTATAEYADLHLQIQPGTDVALFIGMLHAMVWDDRLDRAFIDAHTNGFAALKALVRDTPPKEAARICGVPVEAVLQAAEWFSQSPSTLSLYCQGLNQSSSGTAKNTALINLHLATGQIGRPGAGPFSLTGQPNAMGGREVGGLANLLSAHRDLANPAHRAEVARLWGVESVPERPGNAAVQMFEAAARGEIKALWIACTNPAQSMPDQAMVRAALERCELVVLQEAFAHTATARYADVLLPASTWAEKDGTVTNSERRISRVRAAIEPPGEARADARIVIDFARRLQRRLKPDLHDLFPFESSEAIWNEHRESTRGRDLDITGLSYAMLESRGPQQWPVVAGSSGGGEGIGTARLYDDLVFATADGRARFVATPYRPPAEARDARHPFALNTGRLRDQWHGMSRSGTVPRLFGHDGAPNVRMNPHDLPRRGLVAGDLVELSSRRGRIVLPVAIDDGVGRGEAYVAMHWGEEFVSGASVDGVRHAGVNGLTTRAFCPDSFQPELKHAAVRVAAAELPWRLTAAAWLPAG